MCCWPSRKGISGQGNWPKVDLGKNTEEMFGLKEMGNLKLEDLDWKVKSCQSSPLSSRKVF